MCSELGFKESNKSKFPQFLSQISEHLEDLGLISASTQVAYTMKQQQSLHPELGYYKYYLLVE
jgi:hypothetical protein